MTALTSRSDGRSVFEVFDELDLGDGEASLHAGEDLADAIGAHHDHQEFNAIRQDRRAEGEAGGAIGGIGADGRDHQPKAEADQSIGERAAGQRYDGGQPEQHDGEIFRRGKAQREIGDGLGQHDHDDGGDQAAAESREQRPAQSHGRPSRFRHGMAVPEERHMDGIAGNSEQNGGEGPAIGPRHIEPGEQNERRSDVHLIGEGQNQQHADDQV